ncbi:DNA sulfur modification protein DndB [Planktothrix mougeotii]|uniref:DNA sulfur modification protein DndB n=1 Tax=Planktothrix mougeotii LEGE 06226 TaxID=1828728 RepID=A0ABR9U7J7_9CYAN|nr:DNA sulfur modification protein DndB [Planktothrix mougeotii]MBE9142166.1 DNA sulfur modification protein DndB [Planktothrix mougeotii LEGE 06226]
MNTDNPDISELTQAIRSVLEHLFSQNYRQQCYLGLSLQQGKRQMIQINVPARDLATLLQAKPSLNNDPDSGKNRPEVKGHAEEIKDYIKKRVSQDKPWIIGTLTANVDPEKIEIIELGRGICFIIIPRTTKLDITDGQHRKRAIHELIENIATAEFIADHDFPITLVLESDFNQCQTDFRDMAQTKQLDKSLLVSFGEFSGRIGITKHLVESVLIFKEKTERIKASPANKDRLIYTMNYIVRFVSCVFTDNPSDELTDYNVDLASEQLASCLNQFFEECPYTQHIAKTPKDDLTIDEVAIFKDKCLLGVSIGLEILGRLLHVTYDQYSHTFDLEKVSELAALDWSRESELWRGNVITIDPTPKKPDNPYKISLSSTNIKIAVNTAKAHLGWI